MIPNMYKIAGELTPAVFHIAARSLAAQALSIFGDHSDVMAARATGWAMLCSASVQEAQDLALIAHAATLESRIPFLHFFDGFRTSHEIAKIVTLPNEVLLEMIDEERVIEHRARALSPDHPVIRGTAQNPDVYFQARETVNPFYAACPQIVQRTMDRFADLTGRRYGLFEYHGATDAERVIVLMGSGCEAVHETVDFLNTQNEKVGVLKVRLYRPFDAQAFVEMLPANVAAIAVLDRTKEPGAGGEPLYLDCVNALHEQGRSDVQVVGRPLWFVLEGIHAGDDQGGVRQSRSDRRRRTISRSASRTTLSDTSLDWMRIFRSNATMLFACAVLTGLDPTAPWARTRNRSKSLARTRHYYAQGYFVYDSKKVRRDHRCRICDSGRVRSARATSSAKANFVACHQPFLLETLDVLRDLAPGGTFLLNTPLGPTASGNDCRKMRSGSSSSSARAFSSIDAQQVARECRHGRADQHGHADLLFLHFRRAAAQQAIEAIKNSDSQRPTRKRARRSWR